MRSSFRSLNLVVLCAISSFSNICLGDEGLPTGVVLAGTNSYFYEYIANGPEPTYAAMINFCEAQHEGELAGEVLAGCQPNLGKLIQSKTTNAKRFPGQVYCQVVVQYHCVRPEDYFSDVPPVKQRTPSAPRAR